MAEFYEKQRTNGKNVKKNAVGIVVPETDLQRMLRQNKKQVESLPEHL